MIATDSMPQSGVGRPAPSRMGTTRRDLVRMAALLPCLRVAAQVTGPDGFRVYTVAPRLFLLPARLKLLRRERERRSLRWDQFETLWGAGGEFPEFGWTAALRYQIAGDESAGRQAVAWAKNNGATTDGGMRQVALIADWCAPLISAADKAAIWPKLERALAGAPPDTLSAARTRALAAIVLSRRPACRVGEGVAGRVRKVLGGNFHGGTACGETPRSECRCLRHA